jgi:hypothetical protein
MSAIGPFKICSWSDSGFFKKKNPDDYPSIETRVGVHFTIKTTKKWFYVCISWCKINWISENARWQQYKKKQSYKFVDSTLLLAR